MSDLAGIRVLLIEDEAIIAMMAEDMLTDLGCVVVATLSTLAAALDYSDSFDIALLDLNLGGEDSGPVAERLTAAGRPFIFTTGYGSADHLAGYDSVPLVAKPYRGAEIADALRRALGR